MPLEQALNLVSSAVERPAAPLSPSEPLPGAQTAVHEAVHRAEQSTTAPIQRFPALGEVETAVAEMAPPAVTESLDSIGELTNTMLDESDDATTPNTESDIDLDELSRRVYQALKRKLATERERGYGR